MLRHLQRVLDQQRRAEDAEVGAAGEDDAEERQPERERLLRPRQRERDALRRAQLQEPAELPRGGELRATRPNARAIKKHARRREVFVDSLSLSLCRGPIVGRRVRARRAVVGRGSGRQALRGQHTGA